MRAQVGLAAAPMMQHGGSSATDLLATDLPADEREYREKADECCTWLEDNVHMGTYVHDIYCAGEHIEKYRTERS